MGKAKRRHLQVLRAVQSRNEQRIMVRTGSDIWAARAERGKA